MCSSSLLRTILILSSLGSSLAFNFAIQSTGAQNALSKCRSVNVIWQGGSPPFHMVIIPAFDYPTNVTIPDSAWSSSSGMGNYSWTVNYPAQTRLVAMMSDSTGEGSGGVSPLYTVADSSSNCQMRSVATDFFFYLNSTSVNQCSPLQISWESKAINPVRIIGVIPSGQPFMYSATPGSTSWDWKTNIASGTSFLFGAFDGGKTGIGGSSDLITVGQGSAACLDDSSPSSTPAGSVPTQTTSGVVGTGSGSATNVGSGVKTVTAIATVIAEGKSKGLSTGAIAGIVISAVLALLALQGALFWFCCRRQVSDLLSHRKDMRTKGIKSGEVDLASQYGESQSQLDTFGAGGQAGGVYGRSNNGRTSYGGTDILDDNTISPFHDDRASSRPDLLGDRLGSAYGAYDSDSVLVPPRIHSRNDSGTSGLTLDLPMSTFDSSGLFPGDPPYPTTRSNSDQSSSSPTIGQPRPRQTKRELAASLSLQNADMEGIRYPYAGIMPSQSSPIGGLRRHEDAGPAAAQQGRADVEDLPPLYRSEWQSQSQDRDIGRQER